MRQSPRPALNIAVLPMPRFTLGAFGNFVDVLRLSADERDRSRPIRCAWSVLSHDGAPVRASCGVSVSADGRFDDPQRFDYVVVVGGLLEEDVRINAATAAFLRSAAASGVPLVGVCTGAFILCALGLMEGYRCCVSWFHREDFLNRFEGLEPIADQIYVIDRDRLTCSGGVSAAHLAAALVARHVDPAAARKSLSIMIIDEALGGDRPQPALAFAPAGATARSALLKRALHLMEVHIDTPLSAGALAAKLGTSQRTLERRFADELGMTPAAATRQLRLAEAQHLLAHTAHSITAIASATGFADASHFARTFKAAFGETPDSWRQAARSSA